MIVLITMEIVIKEEICNFVNQNRLTALFKVTIPILSGGLMYVDLVQIMENHVASLFLHDFSKAFDTVWHL